MTGGIRECTRQPLFSRGTGGITSCAPYIPPKLKLPKREECRIKDPFTESNAYSPTGIKEIIDNVENSGQLIEKDSINNTGFFSEISRNDPRVVSLDYLAENLFLGGKYTTKLTGGVLKYNIISSQIPCLKLATLYIPSTESSYNLHVEITKYSFYIFDLTLTFKLSHSITDNPDSNILEALVPLFTKDLRIPENEQYSYSRVYFRHWTSLHKTEYLGKKDCNSQPELEDILKQLVSDPDTYKQILNHND